MPMVRCVGSACDLALPHTSAALQKQPPGRIACSAHAKLETLTRHVHTQVSIPLWALVHLPVVVTITTAVFTPKGWLHCILYVLFENAMGIVKLWAVIAGPPSC